MYLPNGSTILVIPAVSANVAALTGLSSNGFNLAGYTGAMLIGATASHGSLDGAIFKVVRSATSNGTFSPFGMSLSSNQGASGTTFVRSFLINTSAIWHKVVYNNGSGSSVPYAFLLGFGARTQPVTTQNALVTVQADVLSG